MNLYVISMFILTCFLLLKRQNILDLDVKTSVIVTLAFLLLISNKHLFEDFETSNEAVQTVASVYNSGKLTATELNITGAASLGSLNLLPRGVIVAWNSEAAPTGWALCDGQNGTPDLRGRFIRMKNDDITGPNAWASYVYTAELVSSLADKTACGNSRTDMKSSILKFKLGDKGGTDHHVLDAVEIPPHTHGFPSLPLAAWGPGPHAYAGGLDGGGLWDGAPWKHIDTTLPGGGGAGHNNMPPFYVMCYIMKL